MAKITLIDDSSATLDLLTAILQREGHTVQALSSGVGAEAKLSENTPNLVLLDVVMPERNGYETLRALKRQSATKGVPVIMISSKGEDTDIRWGLRQGAADYLTKPVDETKLLGFLSRTVAAYSLSHGASHGDQSARMGEH